MRIDPRQGKLQIFAHPLPEAESRLLVAVSDVREDGGHPMYVMPPRFLPFVENQLRRLGVAREGV
jgi:hypothetical protein